MHMLTHVIYSINTAQPISLAAHTLRYSLKLHHQYNFQAIGSAYKAGAYKRLYEERAETPQLWCGGSIGKCRLPWKVSKASKCEDEIV